MPNRTAFVTGGFYGSATFGTTVLTGAGFDDVFLARYDATGSLIWGAPGGGNGFDSARSVTSLADGTIRLEHEDSSYSSKGGGELVKPSDDPYWPDRPRPTADPLLFAD